MLLGSNAVILQLVETSNTSGPVAALLHEAAETHHVVYRIVDGVDPDWASWYWYAERLADRLAT